MKKLIMAFAALFGMCATPVSAGDSVFDYDNIIVLDAEAMAETGIKEAYDRIRPLLSAYVDTPADLVEYIDSELPGYSVSSAGVTYHISSPALPSSEGEAWGRATYALFSIVNSQLNGSPVKLYAINGGNDLGGLFLSEQAVAVAKSALRSKADWPYLPTLERPWYGQYH